MSVNTKYQHVLHLALLSATWVCQVVCAPSPPAADDLPAIVASYLTLLVERHQPYRLVCTLALVEEQLRILQVYGTLD